MTSLFSRSAYIPEIAYIEQKRLNVRNLDINVPYHNNPLQADTTQIQRFAKTPLYGPTRLSPSPSEMARPLENLTYPKVPPPSPHAPEIKDYRKYLVRRPTVAPGFMNNELPIITQKCTLARRNMSVLEQKHESRQKTLEQPCRSSSAVEISKWRHRLPIKVEISSAIRKREQLVILGTASFARRKTLALCSEAKLPQITSASCCIIPIKKGSASTLREPEKATGHAHQKIGNSDAEHSSGAGVRETDQEDAMIDKKVFVNRYNSRHFGGSRIRLRDKPVHKEGTVKKAPEEIQVPKVTLMEKPVRSEQFRQAKYIINDALEVPQFTSGEDECWNEILTERTVSIKVCEALKKPAMDRKGWKIPMNPSVSVYGCKMPKKTLVSVNGREMPVTMVSVNGCKMQKKTWVSANGCEIPNKTMVSINGCNVAKNPSLSINGFERPKKPSVNMEECEQLVCSCEQIVRFKYTHKQESSRASSVIDPYECTTVSYLSPTANMMQDQRKGKVFLDKVRRRLSLQPRFLDSDVQTDVHNKFHPGLRKIVTGINQANAENQDSNPTELTL